MASDQTRSAILAAAERLYADRGFGDVTLRDIVAEANVNLAAVNYHFGSKDELIAELFVTRSLATNRERLNELKAAEEKGGGRAGIDDILRALVGPTLRGCLGPDREGSTAARFMIRASIESVPPIRRIKNREIDHLRKFAAAMRRAMPGRADADLYWGLHFALAMSHHTIREKERLAALRLHDGVFVLETMFWPDEIRNADFDELEKEVEVRPQELAMAKTLIDNLTDHFQPDQFTDSYRQRLEAAAEAKIAGQEVAVAPTAEPTQILDLMEALKASVEATKAKRDASEAERAEPARASG